MNDKWTTLERVGDVLRLHRDANSNDEVLHAPIQSILNWQVDWNVGGGMIELRWITGHGATKVIFADGDQGAACAAALSTIEEARAWKVDTP